MNLEDAGSLARVRFLIRDRDGKYPGLIDEILGGAGIATILTGVRVPRMNAIMERSLAAAAPWRARLQPLGPDRIERLVVLRRDRLGGVLHEYRHAA
ncbi:hypothetical protein [Lentzea sp. NPDC004782]|uniref:hypothetical protein n=1 Tax=Lentzea sp. NPDC004782 TaxID=3154458 RepID=UPI0033A4247D